MLNFCSTLIIQNPNVFDYIFDFLKILDFLFDLWKLELNLEPNISGQEELICNENTLGQVGHVVERSVWCVLLLSVGRVLLVHLEIS
jgi:hypothetical protein